MVVVEKLTKDTHFIPMNLTHKAFDLVDIYMREIPRLHSVPKTTFSYKHPKFTSNFLERVIQRIWDKSEL
jgi:hypothetical protein